MVQQWLEIGGHRIAVVAGNEQAAGPAVVCLHGIRGSVNFWPAVLPQRFLQEVRWYSISLPGHFPSTCSMATAEQLSPGHLSGLLEASLTELLGDEPVALVGWSTGGFAALHLAATYPRRVLGVLSISGFSRGRWRGILAVLQALVRLGKAGELIFRGGLRLETSCRPLFSLAQRLGAGRWRRPWGDSIADGMWDVVRHDAAKHDLALLAHWFRETRDWDIGEQLQQIQAPTIIVGGTHDPIIPYGHARKLAAAIPSARLITWENIGHLFFVECPAAYAEMLNNWYDEIVRLTTRRTPANSGPVSMTDLAHLHNIRSNA